MRKILIKKTGYNTYLIYVNHDGINIACEIANDEIEKNISINTFLLVYFSDYSKGNIKSIVEEITL